MACDYLSMVGFKLNHVSKKRDLVFSYMWHEQRVFQTTKNYSIILNKSNVNIVDLKNNHILLLMDRNVLFWTHYGIVT